MLNCPPDLLNSVKDLSIFLMRLSYIFVAALWYSYKLCAVYLGLSFVCVMILMHVIGDGGFFLTCEDFLRRLDHSFPACELKKRRLACVHKFLSLGQDQSTVAHLAEMIMTECSLTSRV